MISCFFFLVNELFCVATSGTKYHILSELIISILMYFLTQIFFNLNLQYTRNMISRHSSPTAFFYVQFHLHLHFSAPRSYFTVAKMHVISFPCLEATNTQRIIDDASRAHSDGFRKRTGSHIVNVDIQSLEQNRIDLRKEHIAKFACYHIIIVIICIGQTTSN